MEGVNTLYSQVGLKKYPFMFNIAIVVLSLHHDSQISTRSGLWSFYKISRSLILFITLSILLLLVQCIGGLLDLSWRWCFRSRLWFVIWSWCCSISSMYVSSSSPDYGRSLELVFTSSTMSWSSMFSTDPLSSVPAVERMRCDVVSFWFITFWWEAVYTVA